MTIFLDNSVFLHIPKTGGMWVRKVLISNKLDRATVKAKKKSETTNNIGSQHNVPHENILFLEQPNRFCFVRHPLSWYQSYWAFKIDKQKWGAEQIDILCKSGSFTEFIDNVIRYYPNGYLGDMFDFYTQHCTAIGKQEYLQSDLERILGEYEGITDILFPERPINAALPAIKDRAIYTPTQLRQIQWIERGMIERYGYN